MQEATKCDILLLVTVYIRFEEIPQDRKIDTSLALSVFTVADFYYQDTSLEMALSSSFLVPASLHSVFHVVFRFFHTCSNDRQFIVHHHTKFPLKSCLFQVWKPSSSPAHKNNNNNYNKIRITNYIPKNSVLVCRCLLMLTSFICSILPVCQLMCVAGYRC